MTWSQEKFKETAEAIIIARQSGKARDTFAADDIPADLDTAYAVQSLVCQKWPDQLVGFKVGGIPPTFRDKFAADWLVGPVFAKNVYHIEAGNTLDFPMYEGGFAAFEPELVFSIDADAFKGEDNWTAETARRAIKRIYLGAEIAASPNINVNVLGPGSIISDLGNNAGVILGKEIPVSELDTALSVMTETRIDGETINACAPHPAPAGPLGALAFLLNHLKSHAELYEMSDTLLVSSGAITGVHQSHAGAVGELDYKDHEVQTIRLVPGAHENVA